jgi:hypothetical protein
MPCTSPSRIQVLRVPTVDPAQTNRQSILLAGNGNQVYVIAHQAVSKNPNAGSRSLVA